MSVSTTRAEETTIATVVQDSGLRGMAAIKLALYCALPATEIAGMAVAITETEMTWRGVTIKRTSNPLTDIVNLVDACHIDGDIFYEPTIRPSSWMRVRWSGTSLYLFGAELFGKAIQLADSLEDEDIDTLIRLVRETETDPNFTFESVTGKTMSVKQNGGFIQVSTV